MVCGSERGAGAHEFRKIAVDDAVALLDGIVAREDVLGVVAAKWQVKGVKGTKNTPPGILGALPKTQKSVFRLCC